MSAAAVECFSRFRLARGLESILQNDASLVLTLKYPGRHWMEDARYTGAWAQRQGFGEHAWVRLVEDQPACVSMRLSDKSGLALTSPYEDCWAETGWWDFVLPRAVSLTEPTIC